MLLGVGLAAVVTAQTLGALAIWPDPPMPRKPTKGLRPLRAEEKNELVRENRELQHKLTGMTRDRDRLDKNATAAIEERDQLRIDKGRLELRCDDLVKECKRIRKAAIRSEVDGDDTKD